SCQRPEVVTQVGEVEQALRLGHGQVQAPQRVRAATRRGDGSRQAVLGDVADHRADPPDPAGRGLELAEVGLPDPVAAGGWVMKGAPTKHRPRFASARYPRGSSNPRRRKARCTVEVDT